MTDNEKEEAANLKEEFEWVLREEVHAILHQLHSVLVECAHRFPVPLYGNEGQKQDKFILTSQPEQLKCIVTLTGDSITHADISFKVLRQMHTICRTSINQDGPWKLQQIQDAANHLQQAIGYIDNVDKHYIFRSSDEVLHIIQCLIGSLQRARTALVLPKKKAIDELMNSRNMKALSPNLPEDLAISFYIQSHKLIFVTYQLTSVHGTMRIDSCQADCAVPWLSDVLWMLTAASHMCQQLKDKDIVADENVPTTEYMITDEIKNEITMHDIMKVLKYMKIGKAAGYDRFSSEMLSGCGVIVAACCTQWQIGGFREGVIGVIPSL
ncbi:Protein rogdi [Eumeta japonica]|uniref:Protein rogdi n=1 Tax=Eumeta variegata TaxID=151549 RepID=A0A4C1UDN2_EUMVA|nr:Protein rogdi [Eumeta japonica]